MSEMLSGAQAGANGSNQERYGNLMVVDIAIAAIGADSSIVAMANQLKPEGPLLYLSLLGSVAGAVGLFRHYQSNQPERFRVLDRVENYGTDLIKQAARVVTLQARKLSNLVI